MEHENAFGWGPVRCVSAPTYLRLRFLDAHTTSEEVPVCVWWLVVMLVSSVCEWVGGSG